MNERSRLALIIRGVAAAFVLPTIAIVTPVALWRLVGWPLPTELPSWEQFSAHLTDQSIPDLVLFKSLALLCWVAWVQFAVALMAEGWALAHGRSASRVPLAGPIQFGVASLVGSVALALALLRSQIPSTPMVSITAFASTTMTDAAHLKATPLSVVESETTHAKPSATEVPEPSQVATYIVQPKDCLWHFPDEAYQSRARNRRTRSPASSGHVFSISNRSRQRRFDHFGGRSCTVGSYTRSSRSGGGSRPTRGSTDRTGGILGRRVLPASGRDAACRRGLPLRPKPAC